MLAAMPKPNNPSGVFERVSLVLVLTLGLFTTPVIVLWASDGSPWYLVYLLWGIVILLVAWIARSGREHDL